MHPSHRPKKMGPHSHSESHSHAHKPERKVLKICLILTAMLMVLEIVGGVYSHSLALLSDAGHVFTDLFTLGFSFVAILLTDRPADFQKTYGYYRAEVLAALLNGILLIGVALLIFYEGVLRLSHPAPIHTSPMFVIAGVGLIGNLISGFLLHRVKGKDLNLKGAYLHILSDTLSSVGVLIGTIVIHFTGWIAIDSLLSMMISAVILFWAGKLLMDSIHILMESTPKHINLSELTQAIQQEVKEIQEIHDLHVWEITTHMYAMTAHLTIEEMPVSDSMKITEKINSLLSERFHIEHTNLQYEC